MKPHAHDSILPLSLRVISEWEKRVGQQRMLIADLKLRGQPTKAAETNLIRYQAFLNQLRNHQQTMQELLSPDPHVADKAARRGNSSKF